MAVPGAVIAVAAGLGLGGLLIWYDLKKKASAPAPTGDPCAGLDGTAKTVCEAALLGTQILGALPNPFNGDADNDARAKAAYAKNVSLNGPGIAPMQPWGVSAGLRGETMVHQNGCQPFRSGNYGETEPDGSPWKRGAVGWSKCAPGTIDMWNANFDTSGCDAHNGYSCDDSASAQPVKTHAAKLDPNGADTPGKEEWIASTLGTGSFDPDDPDPITYGPEHFANGWNRWWVKGIIQDCPPGQCPTIGTSGDGKYFVGDGKCQPLPGSSTVTTGELEGLQVTTGYDPTNPLANSAIGHAPTTSSTAKPTTSTRQVTSNQVPGTTGYGAAA